MSANALAEIENTRARLEPGSCYMRVESTGYSMAGFDDESAAADAITTAKTTIMLGEVLGCFLTRPGSSEAIPETAPIVDALSATAVAPLKLPSVLARQLAALRLSKKVTTRRRFGGLFAAADQQGEQIVPVEGGALHDMIVANTEPLARVRARAEEGEEDARWILHATEWAFDAQQGYPSPFTHIQICVAFEAVYGGVKVKDLGVMETLAHRVAYSLAPPHRKRAEMRKRFKDFYGRRSDIAHGRASRLSAKDIVELYWAQGMFRQVLKHELGLVERGPDEEKDEGAGNEEQA